MAISSLRIRCLTESQPETRLSRILHKEQFDEAEQFARLYNLNVEVGKSLIRPTEQCSNYVLKEESCYIDLGCGC